MKIGLIIFGFIFLVLGIGFCITDLLAISYNVKNPIVGDLYRYVIGDIPPIHVGIILTGIGFLFLLFSTHFQRRQKE